MSEREKKIEISEVSGRLSIVDALLDPNSKLEFDSSQDIRRIYDRADEDPSAPIQIFNPRSFEMLLESCNGTPEDFISMWDDYCNPEKRDLAATILTKQFDKNYKSNNPFYNLTAYAKKQAAQNKQTQEEPEEKVFGGSSSFEGVTNVTDPKKAAEIIKQRIAAQKAGN